jgi:SAM-dependent methyltransferase
MSTFHEMVAGYDTLAAQYAETYCNELDYKPFDRALLQRFLQSAPKGTLCDLGCGPGHVAAYLQSLGSTVIAMDVSPQMVAEAKQRFPNLDCRIGDMLDLEIEKGSLAGIVALYSIIHLERAMLPRAIREMHRALQGDGLLLLSFHKGDGDLQLQDVWGTGISLGLTLFQPDEVALVLREAGLSVYETTVRKPYEIEYPTERVYVMAGK